MSGYGNVTCFEPEEGKVKWSVDVIKEYKGKNVRFGYSESLVVDEKNVYCTPGAEDANVIALDKITGKLVWKTKALGEIASYCSPLLIKLSARNILVTFSTQALIGIDTKNGTLLWSHKQDRDGDIHGNTPIFDNGFIYYNSAAGNGSVKLELAKDGSSIKEIWRAKKCSNAFGGVVKVNNILYGSGYEPRRWKAVDANKGAIIDSLDFDRGVTIFADNMLYLYNEKGEVGLVKINNNKMELVSSFKIKKGTSEHFAHQVISNGVLYVRHGNVLLAYDIKMKN
jgi:outer membrane protein assembly factor BamB